LEDYLMKHEAGDSNDLRTVSARRAGPRRQRGRCSLTEDEGSRPGSTAEGLAEGKSVSAGNASQLSDGA
jgi:hypothetical protein